MLHRAREWFAASSYSHQQWSASQVAARLAEGGERVAVVIPARNEERTVADVVTAVRTALVDQAAVVDELIVIDSDSTDATADIAAAAGARVYRSREIAPGAGSYPGKGEALWKSLFVTTADLILFIDADLTHWGPHFVTGLLGPLLADPRVHLVKGYYDRILTREGERPTPEGGRVTELLARPLLNLWWPELAGLVQPLAGEWAVRRTFFEQVSVPTGYGVEIAAVLDAYARYGLDGIAQVDLGSRAHRHQKDHDLAVMAAEILGVAYQRGRQREGGGAEPPSAAPLAVSDTLQQPVRDASGATIWRERPVPVAQRPPAVSVAGYAR